MDSGLDRGTPAVIYHGTPITPRSALNSVCVGRAMCVSFFRPDDVEAVEAISPDIMFRQRRVFDVEGCATSRRRMGRKVGLVGLLSVARTALIPSGQVGGDPRHARCAKSALRCTAAAMAVWAEGCAALAHGRANRTPSAALRSIRPGVSRLDRRGQASRQARVSRADGRSGQGFGQSLAGSAHDARDRRGLQLSICQRRRNNVGTERVAI